MNTNNKPLETELVNSSFNNAYKDVMALGTAIESRQAGIESSLATLASDVGDVTALTTEDKDNLVEAINEVDSHADANANAISAEVSRASGVEGTLSNLSTSAKTNLVAAINEVDSHADANASNISSLQSGKQDKLSTAQMDAVNSGIDSTKVAQIATNADNISALSSGKVDKTTKVNGHALSGDVTVTKADVGLGNVANVGSSGTPVEDGTDNFTTGGAYTELAKKADVSDTGNKADLETTSKTTLVAAINEVNTEVGTKADDDAVVKLTGDQTVSGVKTFSSAPKIPSLTTETPITSTAGVGYDENGNLIPITVGGGGGGTVLPASADYVKTNAQGEAQKGTADTTVTPDSSALVTSGAVATALSSKQDALDTDQLAAVNSGIDSTKVSTYDGYASQISDKQDTLVSGTNIKTINNNSIVGSGDLELDGTNLNVDNDAATPETISAAVSRLDTTDANIQAQIAANFSGTTPVGAYRVYQGKLYRCTTAHTGSNWNASHFTEVKVGTELESKLNKDTYMPACDYTVTKIADFYTNQFKAAKEIYVASGEYYLDYFHNITGEAVDIGGKHITFSKGAVFTTSGTNKVIGGFSSANAELVRAVFVALSEGAVIDGLQVSLESGTRFDSNMEGLISSSSVSILNRFVSVKNCNIACSDHLVVMNSSFAMVRQAKHVTDNEIDLGISANFNNMLAGFAYCNTCARNWVDLHGDGNLTAYFQSYAGIGTTAPCDNTYTGGFNEGY